MKITKNTLVHIDYTLKDKEDNILNEDEKELIYLHGGYGHVFQTLEDVLEGKEAGDAFKVTLTPQQAFGEYDDELVVKESLGELPEEIEVGTELDVVDDSKEELIYIVTEIGDDYAILDANHPLAGLTLTFEGRVMELEELGEDAIKEILEHEEAHHH